MDCEGYWPIMTYDMSTQIFIGDEWWHGIDNIRINKNQKFLIILWEIMIVMNNYERLWKNDRGWQIIRVFKDDEMIKDMRSWWKLCPH